MADLSTLDATVPGANDPASSGDDTIRETRDAVKTSFGGTDAGTGSVAAEHYLKGPHKFPSGTTAARPAAGNAGRLYLNTQQTWVEYDTGTQWNLLNTCQPVHDTDTVTLTGAYQVLSTATVTVPNGGRALLIGTIWAKPGVALDSAIGLRLRSQATFTLAEAAFTKTAAAQATVPICYLDPAPTPGTVAYTLEAFDLTGSCEVVSHLVAIVL